jgi:hypothetical protein
VKDWDWVLAAAVASRVNATLWVGGVVVCGDIIGEQEYLSRVTAAISSGAGEGAPGLAEAWGKAQTLADEVLSPDGRGEGAFLHLENVRIIQQQGAISHFRGGLMRVRRASIDAWIPGAVEPERT